MVRTFYFSKLPTVDWWVFAASRDYVTRISFPSFCFNIQLQEEHFDSNNIPSQSVSCIYCPDKEAILNYISRIAFSQVAVLSSRFNACNIRRRRRMQLDRQQVGHERSDWARLCCDSHCRCYYRNCSWWYFWRPNYNTGSQVLSCLLEQHTLTVVVVTAATTARTAQ